MELEYLAKKWALQNAVRYGGRAQLGAVIAKLVSEAPEVKKNLKALQGRIKKVVDEVNRLTKEKQLAELEKIAPELLEEKPKEEKKELKPLPKAEKGKVLMRLAPSPSGPLHIGHAYVLGLTALYCERYSGKLILRIEDTNPENIYEPAYRMLVEDAQWLTNGKVKEVVIQSERLHIYYDYAEKLFTMGKAYVCTCDPEVWKALTISKKACPCRELSADEQLLRWDKMFVEYEPGEAVVRIKTSLEDPNPAMRDWPALRINHHVHPKTGKKHRVWPLMNFSVAIDDHELGITHTIRGKDHKDNEKRQRHIFEAFGWEMPVHLYVGRINFTNLDLSTTKMRQAIERGAYKDWDDPRLPTLIALRRRGYKPEALLKYAGAMGLNESDKTISSEEFFKILDAFNREIVEPIADRYFFVKDPVELLVKNAQSLELHIPKHPSFPEKGKRHFSTGSRFLISKDDFEKLEKGKVYRLMDCLNLVFNGKEASFHSLTYEDYEKSGSAGIMHWLPAEKPLPKVKVTMPNGEALEGVGEEAMMELEEGAIVQLVRFGYSRLDKASKKLLEFYFAHK